MGLTSSNERLSSVCGIFRNNVGLPFLAYVGQISGSSLVESELHTNTSSWTHLANKYPIHDLSIEGDCAVIMESMHKEGNLSWNLMHVLSQIKFLTTKYKS